MCLNKWKAIDSKMADISEFIKKYSKYQTTFKVTSYDDNNDIHLCTDELNDNINFDKIIEDIYPEAHNRPNTFDAIYIKDNDIYCIEFKNENKPDKKLIEKKLTNGKKELDKLFAKLNIQKDDYKFIFCLVYNIHKPKFDRWKKGTISYTINNYLKKYKDDKFISDIFTEDVEFFSKQFSKKTKKRIEMQLEKNLKV